MRNLETLMGQITSALNKKPKGGLPSDTQYSWGEGNKCKVITMRSVTELENSYSQKTSTCIVDQENVEKDEENKDGWVEVQLPMGSFDQHKQSPRVPYP